MSTEDRNRAWVEVRTASLLRNLRRIREAVGPAVGIVPMVKADAYGLGGEPVAALLSERAIAGLGVASVGAAERLRAADVAGRVIVFTPLAPGEEARAARCGAEVVAGSAESVERALAAGLRVHLEIDTGMGRAGVPPHEVAGAAGALRRRLVESGLWSGVFTHLHSADEPGAPGVREQHARFADALELLDPPAGVDLHISNSAGALLRSDSPGRFRPTLVRPGIHLYGGGSGPDLPAPNPVISVRARVVRVAEMPAGSTLGYGATHRAPGPERWATLAIGYGDGVPRSLSNRGRVLVAGRSAPIVGRVSMDMTVANISDVEGVRVGDVATLIGRDGDEEITLDEVARQAGTISYEILTGLSARLPRIRETE